TFNNLNDLSDLFINPNALLSSNNSKIAGFLLAEKIFMITPVEKEQIRNYFNKKSQIIQDLDNFEQQ
ncbi:MAG TPA: hypothetical protein PK987_12645, partial [Ferruginibacter sp.]|nr:hypothetical protein [Ferruginibacter sp.]